MRTILLYMLSGALTTLSAQVKVEYALTEIRNEKPQTTTTIWYVGAEGFVFQTPLETGAEISLFGDAGAQATDLLLPQNDGPPALIRTPRSAQIARYNTVQTQIQPTDAVTQLLGYTCKEYTVYAGDLQASVWVTEELPAQWSAFPALMGTDFIGNLVRGGISGMPLQILATNSRGEVVYELEAKAASAVNVVLPSRPANAERLSLAEFQARVAGRLQERAQPATDR